MAVLSSSRKVLPGTEVGHRSVVNRSVLNITLILYTLLLRYKRSTRAVKKASKFAASTKCQS